MTIRYSKWWLMALIWPQGRSKSRHVAWSKTESVVHRTFESDYEPVRHLAWCNERNTDGTCKKTMQGIEMNIPCYKYSIKLGDDLHDHKGVQEKSIRLTCSGVPTPSSETIAFCWCRGPKYITECSPYSKSCFHKKVFHSLNMINPLQYSLTTHISPMPQSSTAKKRILTHVSALDNDW